MRSPTWSSALYSVPTTRDDYLHVFWRRASIPMRPHAGLYDLLTQTTCHGDHYCILVLGTCIAFVHAHNHVRHNRKDPGNSEDCMRLMAALTLAHAHALQHICFGRLAGDLSIHNFRLLATKANYRQLPTVRTATRLTGVDFWRIGHLR